MPSKDKEKQTPAQKRRAELIAEVNEIRAKQGAGKSSRTSKLDQIKRLDEQMRSRIAEQKTARGKVPFKSVDELDRQIEKLDAQVNAGTMKIVDEKKALAEISSLKKQRKNFSQFDDSQKQIDDLKAKIKEIKDSMDDPEAKAMSERYNKAQAELDAIKAEADEAYKGLSALRDERTKLHAEQQETFQAIRKIKDDYWQQKKAAQAYEREARDRARERRQAEHDRYRAERKKAHAQEVLAEASDPAYLEEIRRATGLLRFLDPSLDQAEKAPLLADRGLGAQADRKVDGSDIKGTKILSKKDRDDELFPATKKGKKGKKSAGPAADKFSCPPSVVEDCASMGIDPPMSAADIPATIEKVKAKLDHWKSDQEAQTQRVRSVPRPLTNTPLTRPRTSRRPRRSSPSSRPRRRPTVRPPTARPTSRPSPRTSRRLPSRHNRPLLQTTAPPGWNSHTEPSPSPLRRPRSNPSPHRISKRPHTKIPDKTNTFQRGIGLERERESGYIQGHPFPIISLPIHPLPLSFAALAQHIFQRTLSHGVSFLCRGPGGRKGPLTDVVCRGREKNGDQNGGERSPLPQRMEGKLSNLKLHPKNVILPESRD
jgi:uncharacterized coiled-coil DUF342 family protein